MRRHVPLVFLLLSACPQTGGGQTPAQGQAAQPAPAAAETDTIVLGEFGSLTGAEATFGTSTRDGIALAIDEENAHGGVRGKKLAVIVYDDQGKQEEAATAVTKLVTSDKVKAILGEVASSRSLAGAPIAQRYHVPMITPSSTNPKVTQVGDYVFRVCFIDPFQGTVMAKFAKNSLKLARVAVFRDIRNDYSVGLADYFTATFKQLGGEIVDDQSYSAGDPDFKSQLTAMRAKKPEAIFVPGYYTDVGLIAKQARELGVKAPLLGGDGWDSPKLAEIGGASVEGSYFSNHTAEEDPRPELQNFIKAYAAKYGHKPDALAGLAYDSGRLLADAMRRARSLDGPDVRDALAATQGFKGATGAITIDKDRNATKPAVVLKVEGGRWKYVESINP